ncbi:hypothetical protein ABBQ32_009691 [Trebouxia sp. C0010 RCD-2024]
MSRRYSGEDALAYQEGPQDAAGPVNYVQKRLQKRKGIEVVFDPKGQKDFLTGFRQRKQKRRKEAAKQIEKKERQAKLQERAERKQALRDKLNLDQFESDSEAPDRRQQDKDSARPSSVSVHEFGQYSAVVTVKPISIHSDSEEAVCHPSSSDEGVDEPQTSRQAPGKLQTSQAAAKPPQPKKQKPSAVFRKKMKHAGANGKKKGKKRKDKL